MRSGLAAVEFEPTPPKRLVPKTSALDLSAMLPGVNVCYPGYYVDQWITAYKWPAPNVSAFIAQLVTASHRYFEVAVLNSVEIVKFQARIKKSVDIWWTIGIVLGCEKHHIRSFLANFMSGLDNNLLNARGKFTIQISTRAENSNLRWNRSGD